MSLRGTLGDFGIADIFQLIGHQAKTGVLHLKDREIEVRISFVEGNVVKAEQSSRDKADLLGNIMVRARVLTQAQLDEALGQQQRTMRRLGDILVEMQAVDRATLKEFARLQTTETIYRVFSWKAGTYEFKAESVDYDDASYEPIRSENLLMEGFRMVDEWPSVRKVVPSNQYSFIVLKPLPPPGAADDDDDDLLAGLDDALNGDAPAGPRIRSVGEAERFVYPMIAPGRTVAQLVDLTRMGEFETTKALATLVSNGIIGLEAPVAANDDDGESVGALLASELRPFVIRVGMFAALAAAVFGLTRGASVLPGGLLAQAESTPPLGALQDIIGNDNAVRLTRAIEVERVLRGAYPEHLDAVVSTGIVDESALRGPYQDPYAYRVIERVPLADIVQPPPSPTPPAAPKVKGKAKPEPPPEQPRPSTVPGFALALPVR